MTEKEAKKLFAVMTVAYPNYRIDDIEYTAKVWVDFLGEYSYEQVNMALKAYIATDTSGFAPSIGQIISLIQKCTVQEQLGEMEAWSLVRKAISNGNYGSVEEFEKLPPTIQKAVGSADMIKRWAMSDSNEVSTVIQSNFLRSYRMAVKRDEEYAKMPEDVKRLISSIPAVQIEKKEPIAELPNTIEQKTKDFNEISNAIDECRKKLVLGGDGNETQGTV